MIVDCDTYTMIKRGSKLTAEFCWNCAKFPCSDRLLAQADLKRLLLEGENNLVRVINPSDIKKDLEGD